MYSGDLQQDLLSRTLLPLGKYRKPEIRQMAIDYGYLSWPKKVRAMKFVLCRTMIIVDF